MSRQLNVKPDCKCFIDYFNEEIKCHLLKLLDIPGIEATQIQPIKQWLKSNRHSLITMIQQSKRFCCTARRLDCNNYAFNLSLCVDVLNKFKQISSSLNNASYRHEVISCLLAEYLMARANLIIPDTAHQLELPGGGFAKLKAKHFKAIQTRMVKKYDREDDTESFAREIDSIMHCGSRSGRKRGINYAIEIYINRHSDVCQAPYIKRQKLDGGWERKAKYKLRKRYDGFIKKEKELDIQYRF